MLILRLPYLLNNSCILQVEHSGILGNLLEGYLTGSKYGMLGFQIIIGVTQAALLNSLTNNYRMMRDPNLFPGLIWILLICMFPENLCNNSILLANLFFMLCIQELFKLYKNSNVATSIYNTGFYLAISSLFYPGFILFLFPVIIGVQILRSSKIKEFVMLLAGVITPVIILFTIYYWNDNLPVLKMRQFDLISFNMNFQWVANGLYKLIFEMLLVTIVLFMYSKVMFKQSIQNIKYVEILYFLILTGGAMMFFAEGRGPEQYLSIAIPLSVLGGMILFNISPNLAELIHFLMIFAVYFWQFGPNL